jgi:hypothetical protein
VRLPPATAFVVAALLLAPAGATARAKHRPQVVAAAVAQAVVVAGQDATLSIHARDSDAPVYGYSIAALGGSSQGASACAVRRRNGKTVDATGRRPGTTEVFSGAFRFDTPGRYALVVRAISGGCLPAQRGETSAPFVVWVDVVPA